MSLPSPVTSGAAAGIHFRELFDFEVNFSESKWGHNHCIRSMTFIHVVIVVLIHN